MLILSDMLTKVAGQALIGLGYVEKLVIPPGVAGLTGAGLSRNEKLIFCGGAGSAAGTFAKEARIPFEQR
ncbi:MAG: hypothetical protein LBU67_04925 [Oscillospiraceae bacterium]|nr:hypothetical protein [Oscillospiraceae bacterium]